MRYRIGVYLQENYGVEDKGYMINEDDIEAT